jgi:hypothetical protein
MCRIVNNNISGVVLTSFFSVEESNKYSLCKAKVKQSRYRPGVAVRVPGSSDFQIT